MADSLPIRLRSGRLSTTPASSPTTADRGDAELASGRGPVSAGFTVDRKAAPNVVTVSKIAPSVPLKHTLTNRSSTGSSSFISSTRSSINSNSGSDSPVSSPFKDSNPTSPEEEDTSSNKDKTTLSRSPRRTQLPRAGDDAQQSPKSGSPFAEIRKQRKSSTKQGPTPSNPRRTSRHLNGLVAPTTERQRASSAPGITPQLKPGSSMDDPICLSDDDQHASGLGSLTSKEVNNTKLSAKKGRAASLSFEALTSKQRSRTSSAAGRVEGSATDTARDLDANKMPENMDEEPNSAALFHTRPIDNFPNMNTDTQARQSISSTESTGAMIQELTKRHDMPERSSRGSNSSRSDEINASRPVAASPPVQQKGIKGGSARTSHVTLRKSSSKEAKPVEMVGDDGGLYSDTDSKLDLTTDDESATLYPRPRKAGNEGVESDQSFEVGCLDDLGSLSDLSDLRDLDDAGLESDSSSELSDPEDIRSSSEAPSIPGAVPAASEEPPYPNFENFCKKFYNEKDTKVRLIKLMKKKINKPKKPEPEGGDIYIYSAEACPEHFKAGFTSKNITDRIDQQKTCGLGRLSRVTDPNQGRFLHASRVDSLIKVELNAFRRKFACKFCRKPNGSPSRHGEFYDVDPEWMLGIVEKWRRWINIPKYNPYDSSGNLTPRWLWKLQKHDENKEGCDLDSILQPFTDWEDMMYKKDWFVGTCNELYIQADHLGKAVTKSALLVVILFVLWCLVKNLGLKAGVVCFVLLAVALGIVLCG